MQMRWIAIIVAAGAALSAGSARTQDWSVALGAGQVQFGDEKDGFAEASLTRFLGAGYIRGAASYSDGGNRTSPSAPKNSVQYSLGGGYQWNRSLVDGYVRWGQRDPERRVAAIGAGQAAVLESDGDFWAVGASWTYDAPAPAGWSVAPFTAASFSRVDTLRIVTVGAQSRMERTTDEGVTGSIGVAIDRIWSRGSLGIYGAGVATTNQASSNRQGTRLQAFRSALFAGDTGAEDVWAEFGLTGSLTLTDAVALDASIIRTAGLEPSETTFFSTGLRWRF